MFSRLFFNKSDIQELCSSQLFDNDTFYKKFTSDLWCVRRRVYIESPFITTKRIEQLLPILKKLHSKGVHLTVNTRCPDEHEGVYINQAFNAVQAMQEAGVTVLYTVKLHRKLAVIDDVLWEGSLNILSQNDSCEIMRRIQSAILANEMLQFTGGSEYVA